MAKAPISPEEKRAQMEKALDSVRRLSFDQPIKSQTLDLLEESVRLVDEGKIDVDEAYELAQRLMTKLIETLQEHLDELRSRSGAVAV